MSKAEFQITANGADLTQKFDKILVSITVEDNTDYTSDTASIVIDDTDGTVPFPEPDAILKIRLGFKNAGVSTVFTGKVDDISSSGSRSGGKLITIRAKGIDTVGLLKQPQSQHFDKISIAEMLKLAGNKVGITDIRVASEIGSIVRPYDIMDNESFIAFGERLGAETGGVFKVRNGIASLTVRDSGKTASSQVLPTISVAYGKNLHSWRITPHVGRPRFKTIKVKYHDADSAEMKEVVVTTNLKGVYAENVGRFEAPNKEQAQQMAQSLKIKSETNSGTGTVTIEGNANAHPDGECEVSGVRKGIDGNYRISGVKHSYSRGSGYTTVLTLGKKI